MQKREAQLLLSVVQDLQLSRFPLKINCSEENKGQREVSRKLKEIDRERLKSCFLRSARSTIEIASTQINSPERGRKVEVRNIRIFS